VPDNTGGWAIGNIGNSGTAIITNTVPHVSELGPGNGGVAGTIIVTNGGTLPVDNWLVVGRTGGGGNTPLSTLIVAGTALSTKTGDGFIVGDGTFCNGQVFVRDNGHVNISGAGMELQRERRGRLAHPSGKRRLHSGGPGLEHRRLWNRAWPCLHQRQCHAERFPVLRREKRELHRRAVAKWRGRRRHRNNANEWTIGGDNDTSANAFRFFTVFPAAR